MRVELDLIETTSEVLARAYLLAKSSVIAAGFSDEIDYHDDLRFEELRERDFLREAAWVILSSGMREAVVLRKFTAISSAFLDWASSRIIMEHKESCRSRALAIYRHCGKIDAILEVALAVSSDGFPAVQAEVRTKGAEYLRRFSYMGPATSLHLAKNLGLDVVKPDRHLLRISSFFGYNSPREMCRDISNTVGEKAAVIDIVLWRFATLDTNYISTFSRTFGHPRTG